jgi:imidazolonepropionase-like amidohydrolase/Tol biopolymer transport system component
MSYRFAPFVLASLSLTSACSSAREAPDTDVGWRTIEFEATEVTEADLTVSPDGNWLIFTVLGHLYRLPVEGGEAEQLTFGPYYDVEPVYAPDGARVAFVSNRDGSEGNVFVLEVESGDLHQVTHEEWADRPTWSPSGDSLLYLSYTRRNDTACPVFGQVRSIPATGGTPTTLKAEAQVRSVFHSADGRLGWTVIEGDEDLGSASTRIELTTEEGEVSVARTLDSDADRFAVSPAGDGFYARRQPNDMFRPGELVFVSNVSDSTSLIASVSRYWCHHRHPRFAVSSDGRELFFSDGGRLWRVPTASGEPVPIEFKVHVTMEIRAPVSPPEVADIGESRRGVRSILDPALSPDGHSLIFGALGYLWEQPVAGGKARRLTTGHAFEHSPAFAPDGKRLAYIHVEHGRQEIRVLHLESSRTRTIAEGPYLFQPSWSPDGRRLVLARRVAGWFYDILAVSADDGSTDSLARAGWAFPPRPHFSADGKSLIYESGLRDSTIVQRLSLTEPSDPETLVRMCIGCMAALVSSDGTWVAFQRNSELWLAPFLKDTVGGLIISDDNSTILDARAGRNFSFTPDASALVYAAENRVWKHSLIGGEREEIPIRLPIDTPEPPPVLLRQVRVLDLETGFGAETSLLIEGGRIAWADPAESQELPPGTEVLDAGGRFAIPGLFDVHFHAEVAGLGTNNQTAYLAYGVTTVRDMGGALDWLLALDDRSRNTSDPVPRYLYAGEVLEGPPHGCPQCTVVEDRADVTTYVQRHRDEGVHFLKVYTSVPWPLMRAATDEARRLGLPVAAHGKDVRQLTRGVTHGISFAEHIAMPSRFYDDVFQLMAAAGTYWTPTLTQHLGTAFLFAREPDRLSDPKYCAFFPESCGKYRGFPVPPPGHPGVALGERIMSNALADLRSARRRNVRVLLGTDDIEFPPTLGHSLQMEMEVYTLAGLTPLEVLGIATQRAAEALGVADELGSLETGKLADIVLLDANPLEDIQNTQTIWRVIKGGWVFDPNELRPHHN